MPQPNPTLQHVLNENGWRYSEEAGVGYLHIGNEKIRYYDYPEEKHNLPVRRMILQNTLAELEMLLPPELNPGALDTAQLRKNLSALAAKSKTQDEDSDEYATTMQTAAVTEFKLGGQLLLSALSKMAKGAEFTTVQDEFKEGRDLVARAHNHAEFNDMPILGKHPAASFDAQQKLAVNIRDIVDVEEAIEPLITAWYAKIAAVKTAMRQRAESIAASRTEPGASGLLRFAASCERLLEARRNEPEYALAQAETTAEFASLQRTAGKNTRVTDTAQDIYWMARVREPLSARIEKPITQGIRHA